MYAHLFSSLEHIDGGGAEGGAEGGGEGGGGEGSGGEGGIEVEAVAAAADRCGWTGRGGGVRRRNDFHRVEQQDTVQLLTKKTIKLLACMDASCACGRAAKKTSGGKRKAAEQPLLACDS